MQLDVAESRAQRERAEGERERTVYEKDKIIREKEAVIQQLQVCGHKQLISSVCILCSLQVERDRDVQEIEAVIQQQERVIQDHNELIRKLKVTVFTCVNRW